MHEDLQFRKYIFKSQSWKSGEFDPPNKPHLVLKSRFGAGFTELYNDGRMDAVPGANVQRSVT